MRSGAGLTGNLRVPLKRLSPGKLTFNGTTGSAGGTFPTAYDSAVLADSPVGYWPLNETSGTTAHDQSGNHNDGTYTGTFTLAQTGIGDGLTAVLVDGTSGVITIPYASVFNVGNGPFSLEMWVKMTAISAFGAMWAWSAAGDFEFRVTNTGSIGFLAQSTTSIMTSTSSIADTTTFHHVVLTRVGTSSTKIYLDAVDVSGSDSGGAVTQQTSGTLQLGGCTQNSEFLHATIAKAAFYNTSLSSARVSAHFAAG